MSDQPLTCNIHGPFTPWPWRYCPQCEKERCARYDREDAADRVPYHLKLAGIPPRFRGFTFDSFKCETREQEEVLTIARDYVENFPHHRRAGSCLTFSGHRGTGKSMLASIIIQTLILSPHRPHQHRDDIYRCRYTTAIEIIRLIRDTWNAKATSTSVIAQYTSLDLLVIDEIGANIGTESEKTQLFEVIDICYQQQRPMLAISNCTLDGLKRALGERAYDRLRDHGGLLCTFDWETWRGREWTP